MTAIRIGMERSTGLSSVLRAAAGAVVGGTGIAALQYGATLSSVPVTLLDQLSWFFRLCAHWIPGTLPLALAFALVAARSQHMPAFIAHMAAVAAGALGGAGVLTLHRVWVDPELARIATGFDLQWQDTFLYTFWVLAFWGSLAALLHRSRLRERRGAAALRNGELARLRSERELAEARLQSLRAQIEPDFLLQSLLVVERLYRADAAAADRVLDALVRFLRRALPLLRRTTSTIGEECCLLETYVLALGRGAADADPVRISLSDEAAACPLPPGALLPLANGLPLDGCVPVRPFTFDFRAHPESGGIGVAFAIDGDLDDAGRSRLKEAVTRVASRLEACGLRTRTACAQERSELITLHFLVPIEEEIRDAEQSRST